jgi:F-type H+-transporting ATPase subunit epsilon
MADSFFLSVVSPDASLFEGDVRAARIPTSNGLIGVLPEHAPLLALLGTGVLSLESSAGQKKDFIIHGGFLEIVSNKVTVLAGQAESIDKIDLEDAAGKLKEALEKPAHGDYAIQARQAEQDFQRARLKSKK